MVSLESWFFRLRIHSFVLVESPEDDVSKALIQELEYKLAEAQERCAKLEEENCEYSDKVFDLKMDKQRLNVKLQHFTELNKILEENNDELQKEVTTLQEKNEKLNANLEKLEQKIERIEEGDFEHVSADVEGEFLNICTVMSGYLLETIGFSKVSRSVYTCLILLVRLV